MSRDKVGRAHLKRWLDDTLRQQFTGTSHQSATTSSSSMIADHAHGVVYSKNEHETPRADGGVDWVIMQMLYWDNYERRDGRWYFRRRLPCYWYATDHQQASRRRKQDALAGPRGLRGRLPRAVAELDGVLGQSSRQQ